MGAPKQATEAAKNTNAWLSLLERIAKIPTWGVVTGSGTVTVGTVLAGWMTHVPAWGVVIFVLIGLGAILILAVLGSIGSLSSRVGDLSSKLGAVNDSLDHFVELGNVEDRKHYRWRAERWRETVKDIAKTTSPKANLSEVIDSIVKHPGFLDLEPCFSDSTRSTVLRIGIVQIYVHAYGTGTTVHPLLLDIMGNIADFEKDRGLLGTREP